MQDKACKTQALKKWLFTEKPVHRERKDCAVQKNLDTALHSKNRVTGVEPAFYNTDSGKK